MGARRRERGVAMGSYLSNSTAIHRFKVACSAPTALRKGRQRNKTKNDAPTYLPFLRFFKTFRSDFSKYFSGVLGSSCRETAKNATKQIDGKRRKEKSFFFLNFFGQKLFDMDFSQKVFNGVFGLSVMRNAKKRH
jgi:hypothetical protein